MFQKREEGRKGRKISQHREIMHRGEGTQVKLSQVASGSITMEAQASH